METQNLVGIVKAFLVGAIGAFIIWILSGSSASIGFGVLLFYLEATRQNNDNAERNAFGGAQKKKTFWR